MPSVQGPRNLVPTRQTRIPPHAAGVHCSACMRRVVGVALLLLTLLGPCTALAQENAASPAAATAVRVAVPAHAAWDALLAEFVDYEAGLVDYDGFLAAKDRLDAYLAIMADTNPDALAPDDRLAFYLNLYNASAIQLVLTEYPDLDSIRDIGGLLSGPFSMDFIELQGRQRSLDDIEHGIIRPEFGDPRIHFAINCAAMSCPPLHEDAFTGEALDAQLDFVTTNFINDPEKTRLEGQALHVTKIMDWFREDFAEAGGPAGFVRQYARGGFKDRLEALGDEVDVVFQDYDWSLNAQ